MSDRNEEEERPKKKKYASVLSMLLFLIVSTSCIAFGMLDNETRDSYPFLRYVFLATVIGWLISMFFDVIRDWDGRAAENRVILRGASKITVFWKIKTLLLLHCDGHWLVIVFVFASIYNPLHPFFKEHGINIITSTIGIVLHAIMMGFVYVGGCMSFAELYLDLEHVEELWLSGPEAHMKELVKIWSTLV